MEKTRHRKSKSASGIEGIRQTQKQKFASRLSSDSRSYIDGSNGDYMFMLELGHSSLGRASGTPMKKLLAEEMSKEIESKRPSPSVIAKLMGLEGQPSPRHVHKQPKRLSDSYQQKNVSSNFHQRRQPYNDLLSRKSSIEHQEFKDVYEDVEASHIINRRYSSRWSANSILTKPEMALIQQKFIDAKRLSTYEKLRDSKELDDTLELLDSNEELLLKFLRKPNSFFVKHFHDPQVDPSRSLENHIAVLKPSNSAKYEGNAKAWKSENDTLSKHDIACFLNREDGLLLAPHNRHRAYISSNSSKIEFEEKNETKILPTRIVLLKPNLRKMQNTGRSSSSPDHLHGYLPNFRKMKGCSGVGGAETVSWRRKDTTHNVEPSMSKDAREIARDITRRMRFDCDETMDPKLSGFRGYAGDESSYDAYDSDSDSESEMFKLSSRNSSCDNKCCVYPSSTVVESSVNREAKKRLSERWKMTHRYQDVEMVGKGSTLGEMLAIPDIETRPKYLNAKMSIGRACDRLDSNEGTAVWDSPLGISSRDGWKNKINVTSCRSRSLPPSIGGRNYRRSKYPEVLAEDKHLMHVDTVRQGRSKVVKRNPSRKEKFSPKDSKSRSKKHLPCQHIVINEIDSMSEVNFEIEMEAYTKELSRQQPMFQMEAKDETCRKPASDVLTIAECGSMMVSLKSPELLPKQLFPIVDKDKSAAHDQDDSSLQEQHKGGLPEQGSPSSQGLGAEPDSSESSKEADHSSPVSVLEVPFAEEISSSSKSFERVRAELHDLRKQLQLLKMESGACTESPPIEEEVSQLSPKVSEGNHVLGAEDWEESYVLDVIINSGLEESGLDMFIKWHSPECPLDPELFDNLEKKYIDETTGLRPQRKLLFDTINSALFEIFQQQVNLHPWVMPKLVVGLHLKQQIYQVRNALEKLINQDFTNRDEVSERELDREMQWSGSKGEIDVLGSEIEKLLIDDMITEVLYITNS